MVSNDEIKKRLIAKEKGTSKSKTNNRGYLVCEKCGGYYELQRGENPEDFLDKCDCGGNLSFADNLDSTDNNLKEVAISSICPECGMKNPENSIFCQECGVNIKNDSNSSKTDNNPPNVSKNSKGLTTKRNYIVGGVIVLCLGLFLIAGISGMMSPDKTSTNISNTSQPTVNTSNSSPITTPAQDKAAADYDAGYKQGYKAGYYGNSPGSYSGNYGDGYTVGYKLGKQDKDQGLTPEWEDTNSSPY